MMLRVQLERQHEATFPAGEYFPFYGLRLEHIGLAKPDVIVMHPGTDQSRPRDLVRGRRLAALRDPESSREWRRHSHGRARTSHEPGMNSLLIKNGRVIDPTAGLDAIREVLNHMENGIAVRMAVLERVMSRV